MYRRYVQTIKLIKDKIKSNSSELIQKENKNCYTDTPTQNQKEMYIVAAVRQT